MKSQGSVDAAFSAEARRILRNEVQRSETWQAKVDEVTKRNGVLIAALLKEPLPAT